METLEQDWWMYIVWFKQSVKNYDISSLFPANIYLFKVKNRNTRKKCEICSKLTVTSYGCFYCQFWTYSLPFSSASIVDSEEINFSWVKIISRSIDKSKLHDCGYLYTI